jgi:hypothetical protein
MEFFGPSMGILYRNLTVKIACVTGKLDKYDNLLLNEIEINGNYISNFVLDAFIT